MVNETRSIHAATPYFVCQITEKKLKDFEETHGNTTVSWDAIFGNWSSDLSISNGTINWGNGRNKRDVDGTVHAEGILPNPTKPPKTLPNLFGKGILQVETVFKMFLFQ